MFRSTNIVCSRRSLSLQTLCLGQPSDSFEFGKKSTTYTHLSKSQRHTEPSAAQEAIAREAGDWETVAWGWNTIAPALSWWPLNTRTGSQSGTDHNLHSPLLQGPARANRQIIHTVCCLEWSPEIVTTLLLGLTDHVDWLTTWTMRALRMHGTGWITWPLSTPAHAQVTTARAGLHKCQ